MTPSTARYVRAKMASASRRPVIENLMMMNGAEGSEFRFEYFTDAVFRCDRLA